MSDKHPIDQDTAKLIASLNTGLKNLLKANSELKAENLRQEKKLAVERARSDEWKWTAIILMIIILFGFLGWLCKEYDLCVL